MQKRHTPTLLAALLAVQPAFSAPDLAGAQARFTLAQQARNQVQHAAAILASETIDDTDGYPLPPAMVVGAGVPLGGGWISAASAAPKTDGTSLKLGYCAWDNGTSIGAIGRIAGTNTLSAPALAVIAPGANGRFDTSCADIGTAGAKGDDIVISYSTAQLRNLYSLHVGPSVADFASLTAISPSALRDGEIRLVRDDNSIKRWDASSGTWKGVGGSFAPTPGSAAAPAYAFDGAATTGMYHTGSGLGFTVSGVAQATLTAAGLQLTADLQARAVKAETVEADKVKAKSVQADTINSGELEIAGGTGCVPLFALAVNAVYDVRATGDYGWGSLRVSTSATEAFVQETKSGGAVPVDIQVAGNQVCAMAASGKAKASWLRVL